MCAVVEKASLRRSGRSELATTISVTDGDCQAGFHRAQGAQCYADASGDEGSDCSEETLGGAFDRTEIFALERDVGIAIQQIFTRHANMIKPDTPIVDTVQTQLLAAIFDAHSRHRCAVLIANRNQQRVNPLDCTADDELREDDS